MSTVDQLLSAQVRVSGRIPDSVRIPRNVLEWRADPCSPTCNPRVADAAVQVIVVCRQGFACSLAAAVLHDLGLPRATGLDGGFEAWVAAGLPVERAASGNVSDPSKTAAAGAP